MNRPFVLGIAILACLAIGGAPIMIPLSADPANANQAGMSSYCAYMYNIYNRRGVGCNEFGHDFMFRD
jgi:hypothetical protein